MLAQELLLLRDPLAATSRRIRKQKSIYVTVTLETYNETAVLLCTLGSWFCQTSLQTKEAGKGRAKSQKGKLRLSRAVRQYPPYCQDPVLLICQPTPNSLFSRDVLPLDWGGILICKLFSYPQVTGAIQICDIIKEEHLCLNSLSSAEKN